jgi:hypothetical protein
MVVEMVVEVLVLKDMLAVAVEVLALLVQQEVLHLAL